MREKQVYPTDEIPHLWAHGNGATKTKGGIRNSCGNLFCSDDGRTIYSYGYHFPIARRIETKTGVVFLITTQGYSVTTSGHVSAVRWAIQQLGPVFKVDPNNNTAYGREPIWDAIEKRKGYKSAEIVRWFNTKIEQELRAASKPRIRGTTRVRHIEGAKKLRTTWVDLHARFKLPCGVNRVPEIVEDIDALKAQHAADIERARKTAERHEAIIKRERARKADAAYKYLPEWRETGQRVGSGSNAASIMDLPYPALRVCGDRVESSHGARVPVSDAKLLIRRISRLPFNHVLPIEVGVYRGVRVNSEHLSIGCHSIPWSEVFAFCDYYGWDKPTPPTAPDTATGVEVA